MALAASPAAGELRQFVLEVDGLVQPRSEQIA